MRAKTCPFAVRSSTTTFKRMGCTDRQIKQAKTVNHSTDTAFSTRKIHSNECVLKGGATLCGI